MQHIRIERPLLGRAVISFNGSAPPIGLYVKPLKTNTALSRLLGHKKKYVQNWSRSYTVPINPGVSYEPEESL